MKKSDLIIYRVATGLLTLQMLLSAGIYFGMHEMAAEMITALGFPEFIIYPLGVAKLLGLVAIWTDKIKWLTQWAYAGFVFNLLLGVTAHLVAGDGEFAGALVALLVAIISYVYYGKIKK